MIKSLQIFALSFILISFLLPSHAGIFNKNGIKESKVVKKGSNKLLLVEIYASWCPSCKNIQPTLDEIMKEIPDIELIQLDVSTPSKAKIAEKKATDLNIGNFYQANKSKTATVAVIIPFKNDVVTIFQNNNNVDDYKTAIQEAKTKQKALDSEK